MSFYSQLPLEELSEIITRNPEEIELRLALIERYVSDGDLDDALVQACLAQDLDATHPEVLAWKSLCQIFLGQMEAGHRLLQKVARQTPCGAFHTKLVYEIIPAFLAETDIDPDALAQPWSVLEYAGEFGVDGRYGLLLESIAEVGRQMEENPELGLEALHDHVRQFPEDLNAKLYLASVHLIHHELPEAEQLYRDVIDQDPECSTAYFDLAIVVPETDDAIELLQRGLELFPRQDVGRYNLGTFLINAGDQESAKKELSRIPADSSLYSDALLAIGVCYENEEQIELATEYFEKVTVLAPERAEVHAKYGQLLLDVGRKMEALSAFNIALELAPKTFCAWHNKGLIHLDNDQDDLALESFQRALEICPESSWTSINLAVLLRESGKTEKAIEVLLEAQRLNPDEVIVLQNLGSYFNFSNQLEEALEYTQKAIDIDEERAVLHWNMADAYAKLSDRDQCLASLSRACELDSQFADRFLTDKDFEAYWWDADFQTLVERTRGT